MASPAGASRSHSMDKPQSLGLLRTSDQSDTYLYLTTHTIHKKQASMPPARFEPAVAANDGPPTHALDRAATGISPYVYQDY